MGFGSMIHRSVTSEVRKQDQISVEKYLTEGSKLIMNPDGTCDVEGSVDVCNIDLKSLMRLTPRIRKVTGWFGCADNQLTSLKGAPEEVGRWFDCSFNKLTSLEGAPEKVGGSIFCSNNQLESLKGAPEKVGGAFYCSVNHLTSLDGAPKEVGGNFDCYENQLTSLKGAPEYVGGNFCCKRNPTKFTDEEVREHCNVGRNVKC